MIAYQPTVLSTLKAEVGCSGSGRFVSVFEPLRVESLHGDIVVATVSYYQFLAVGLRCSPRFCAFKIVAFLQSLHRTGQKIYCLQQRLQSNEQKMFFENGQWKEKKPLSFQNNSYIGHVCCSNLFGKQWFLESEAPKEV